MSSPSIVLLDRSSVRAAVLRSWGYGVFATDHVVEVCLRWRPDDCAALVIGPLIAWREIATLCEWVKTNYAEAPILLLSERRLRRCPAHVDKVVPSRPPQALLECLRILLPGIADQPIRTLAGARSGSGYAGAVVSTPVQNSPHLRFKIPHLKDQECVSLAPGAAEARAAFWRWGGAELGAKESASADPVPPSCSRPPISPARRRSFSR